MTTLVMMYVYFDANGDIKTISPNPMSSTDTYSSSTFPLTEVEGFLTGKKNPFDYFVKTIKSITGSTYKLVRKQSLDVSLVRTLDTFLTKIEYLPPAETLLFIENDIKNKKIQISINVELRNALDESDNGGDIYSFFTHKEAFLFFTKKDDPYILLHTIVFPPNMLPKSVISIDYDMDLSDSSLYTRKIINGYSYKEIK